MEDWKQSFVGKLNRARSRWVAEFDQALDTSVAGVFDALAAFLQENGFVTTVPLKQSGRRSLKFELAEDAYLLMIFRSTGLGGFELSRESFVPGTEPEVRRSAERVAQLSRTWAEQEIQAALDSFVERLGNVGERAGVEKQLAAV